VALMLGLSQMVVQWQRSRPGPDARMVNIAGRQRMLCERIAKLALQIVEADEIGEIDRHVSDLEGSMTAWKRADEALRRGDPGLGVTAFRSDLLTSALDRTAMPFRQIMDSGRELVVLTRTGVTTRQHLRPAALNILAHERVYVNGMDQVLAVLEVESDQRLANARWVEFALLGLSIIVLLTVSAYLLRPMAGRVEERLTRMAEEERRLLDVLDQVPDAVILLDESGRIVLANASAPALLHIEASRLKGMPAREALGGFSPERLAHHGLLVLPTGDPLPVDVRSVPIEVGERRLTSLIIRDMSDRAAAESEMAMMRDQLAHAARVATVSEMAAGLAHEINQPLAAVVSFAEGARLRIDRDELSKDQMLEVLGRIGTQARRASAVIARLRAFVRREPRMEQELDLAEVTQEVGELLGARFRRDRASLRVERDPDAPLALGDRVLVQQVLLNLVGNSLDAFERSGASERSIHVTAGRTLAGHACVRIRDSGPGIAPERRGALFEPFVAASGLGLGLPLSRRLAEGMGGGLELDAGSGAGAAFLFFLPAADTLASSGSGSNGVRGG
jgi:C4-dicarboxylate-specific signal transduction histidine kinase